MTIKNDNWIRQQAAAGMIEPFAPDLVRAEEDHTTFPGWVQPRKVLSYGCSSYGYDIRLSPVDFQIFRHVPGTVMNPKRFNEANLEPAELHTDEDGSYFILPAHTYGLGVAVERITMPPTVTGICIGKSTYARMGVIANLTPIEAGWKGHLTLEFSNSSGADCRLYANEGICQVLFFEGEPCDTTYHDRSGKYQDQGQSVTVAKV